MAGLPDHDVVRFHHESFGWPFAPAAGTLTTLSRSNHNIDPEIFALNAHHRQLSLG